MEYVFQKGAISKQRRMTEIMKSVAVAKPPVRRGSQISSFQAVNVQTAVSSKKPSFYSPDASPCGPINSVSAGKSRSFNKIAGNPLVDQMKAELGSLKARVLSKIYGKENEIVTQVRNHISVIMHETEKLSQAVLGSINSFSQILSANFNNSFIELEAELEQLERESVRAQRDTAQETALRSDQKLQAFKNKISNYAFDASVFPSIILETDIGERINGFIRLDYPLTKVRQPTNEKNLFLESVHDPFLEERIQRQSVVFEDRSSINRMPLTAHPMSSEQRLEERLRTFRNNRAVYGTQASQVNEITPRAQQTLSNKPSIPKMKSNGSLHNLPDESKKYSLQEMNSRGELPSFTKACALVTSGPPSRQRSPSFSKGATLPSDFSNLKIVDLSKRQIDETQILKLLNELDIGQEGFYLDLSRNLISDQGLKMLLRKLVEFPVVFINLDNNLLGDDSIAFLLSFINYNKALQGVSVKGNSRIRTNDFLFVERKKLLEERNLQVLF